MASVELAGSEGLDVTVTPGSATDQENVVSPLVLPPFVARTPNTWAPSGSAAYGVGLVHAANGPESSRHSNVAPDTPVNPKLADVEADGLGGVAISTGLSGLAAPAGVETAGPKAQSARRARRRIALNAILVTALRRLRLIGSPRLVDDRGGAAPPAAPPRGSECYEARTVRSTVAPWQASWFVPDSSIESVPV